MKNNSQRTTGSCCLKGCLAWVLLLIAITAAALAGGNWTIEWRRQTPPARQEKKPGPIAVSCLIAPTGSHESARQTFRSL